MHLSKFAYDPWELPPKQRRTTFVGREPILDRLLAAIREQEGRDTVQHYMLTGPRGIGKTSLLLTLCDRIRQSPEISSKWFCVQLREEEYYIHKQRDLWQLVLQALADEEKVAEAQQIVRQAEEIRDDEKSSALLVDGLRNICTRHGKRLALLVDNFGQLFPTTAAGESKHRKPDSEYRAFRKRLSTETFLMLIATSVKLFQDIYAYDKGFFHFFSPVELPELTQDEIIEMLRRLGHADGNNQDFLTRLEKSQVNIRTLSMLTGGNPRLITMLYHILAQREMSEPVQALWETVAGLTPMLRQELADMPRQQSKTLDALLRLNGVAAPAEIAKSSRLPLNVVTTQLGRLKEARYVALEGGGKGKKATYRVADQMFSVWYWMRYVPVARRRIELFTDFIRAWFSLEERRHLYQERLQLFVTCQSRGFVGTARKSLLDAEYYAASLDDSTERTKEMMRIGDAYISADDLESAAGVFGELLDENIRLKAKTESLGYFFLAGRLAQLGKLERAVGICSEKLARDPENTSLRLVFGLCLGASERYREAKEQLDRLLKGPGLSGAVRPIAWRMRGLVRSQLGDLRGEIADYTVVVEMKEAPPDEVAEALLGRGLAKGRLGDPHGEIADYTALLALKNAPLKHVAAALVYRGLTKGELGDAESEIADYTAVADLAGAPAEIVAEAFANRGAAKIKLGDCLGAVADCTASVEMKGATPQIIARALVNRGRAKSEMGDQRGEIMDCTTAINLEGADVGETSAGLVNRAAAKGRLGDHAGAVRDCTTAIDLEGAPAEQVGDALYNRGVSREKLEDLFGAAADYTAVVGVNGVSAEIVARALVNRALIANREEDFEGAMRDCTEVARLSGARPEDLATALALRGSLYLDRGKYKRALRDCSESLKIPALPQNFRVPVLFDRGRSHLLLGNLEEGLVDCDQCVRSGEMPFVHNALRTAVLVLLSLRELEEAFSWVRRFAESERNDLSLETRLEARLDMIRQASAVATIEDVSRLVDALLETDPEELRARLRFLKPGLELAKTNDESVLANLPEDERKIAREIARSLAEAARPDADPPTAGAGGMTRDPADSPLRTAGHDIPAPAPPMVHLLDAYRRARR